MCRLPYIQLLLYRSPEAVAMYCTYLETVSTEPGLSVHDRTDHPANAYLIMPAHQTTGLYTNPFIRFLAKNYHVGVA